MARRNYGQACSVARFLDRLGSRWTLLIVRDLLVCPHKFGELLASAPAMGPNLLTVRLRQLQDDGIVTKAARSAAYELTEKGRLLEPVILAMSRWALSCLKPDPANRGASRPDLLVVAFRAAFNAERAVGLSECYEFRVDNIVFSAKIENGSLETALGEADSAAFVLTTDSKTFDLLGSGELSIDDAIHRELISVSGNRGAFDRFVKIFSVGDPTAD